MPDSAAGTLDSGSPAPLPTAAPISSSAPSAPAPAPAPAPVISGVDWEKQFKGVQGDLAKERKARQQFEQRLQQQETQYQTQLEAERNRVRALAGVATQTPQEAENEELRQQLSRVATPDWLLSQLGLSKDELAEFKAAREDRGRVSEIEKHYWSKHGEKMVSKVSDILAKEYGGELTKRQLSKITEAYVFRAQRDPEFLQRHEDGDETLAAEFAKEFLEDWFEPARRKITTTEVGRFRPVPSGQSRGIVTSGEKKINVTSDKEVEDLLVAGFRERGGQFGRR